MGSACGTPQYTNYTVGFADCLDYIFYQDDSFDVEQVWKNIMLSSKKYWFLLDVRSLRNGYWFALKMIYYLIYLKNV